MGKPVKKFSCGTVSAAVWQTARLVDGEMVDLFSVTFDRAYMENGEWKHTDSFKPEDMPKVAVLANETYKFLRLRTFESEREPEGPDEREVTNN